MGTAKLSELDKCQHFWNMPSGRTGAYIQGDFMLRDQTNVGALTGNGGLRSDETSVSAHQLDETCIKGGRRRERNRLVAFCGSFLITGIEKQ